MRITLVVFAFTLTACPTQNPQERCAPSCRGCCDTAGACQTGQSNQSCGASGNACVPCGLGLQCMGGQCGLTNAGGSGGGGTGGGAGGAGGASGGGSGGGVGAVDQELVSGSRLRAILNLGADGSKAPWFATAFWDTQLETICTPSNSFSSIGAATAVQPCLPINSQGGETFIDSACTLRTAPPPILMIFGRTTKSYVQQYRADAGTQVFLVSTTPYVGPLYQLTGAGGGVCSPGGASDGGYYQGTGAAVSLATFTPTIE